MSRYQLPEALAWLVARSRAKRLAVAVDLELYGDYPAAVELITKAGQHMGKTPDLSGDAVRLRFWRRGVDYGVHAFDASSGGVKWVRLGDVR